MLQHQNIKLYFVLLRDYAILIFDKSLDEMLKILREKNFEILEQPEKKDLIELENSFDFLSQIISEHLQSNGLIKISNTLKFIDFSDTEEIEVTINNLPTKIRIFYGFNIEINLLEDNRVILWIDPTYVQFLTMDKWIEFEGLSSDNEVLKEYQN